VTDPDKTEHYPNDRKEKGCNIEVVLDEEDEEIEFLGMDGPSEARRPATDNNILQRKWKREVDFITQWMVSKCDPDMSVFEHPIVTIKLEPVDEMGVDTQKEKQTDKCIPNVNPSCLKRKRQFENSSLTESLLPAKRGKFEETLCMSCNEYSSFASFRAGLMSQSVGPDKVSPPSSIPIPVTGPLVPTPNVPSSPELEIVAADTKSLVFIDLEAWGKELSRWFPPNHFKPDSFVYGFSSDFYNNVMDECFLPDVNQSTNSAEPNDRTASASPAPSSAPSSSTYNSSFALSQLFPSYNNSSSTSNKPSVRWFQHRAGLMPHCHARTDLLLHHSIGKDVSMCHQVGRLDVVLDKSVDFVILAGPSTYKELRKQLALTLKQHSRQVSIFHSWEFDLLPLVQRLVKDISLSKEDLELFQDRKKEISITLD